MKKLSNYLDYCGTDASNEISLFEYGLLCKKTGHEIHCIIGAGVDDEGNYNKFHSSSITEGAITRITNESWFDKNGFLSYIGQTEEDFLNSWFVNKIADMILYYGFENIFGSPYGDICYFDIINK